MKETCISWDKRVHRGNTYSMYTQNAIKEVRSRVSSALCRSLGAWGWAMTRPSKLRNSHRPGRMVLLSFGTRAPVVCEVSPKVAKKRRPKEPQAQVSRRRSTLSFAPLQEKSIFDMPLPEHERVPVDLTKHLVASEEPLQVGRRGVLSRLQIARTFGLQVEVVECQTDEFLPEPPPEQYQPQRPSRSASDESTMLPDD